MFYVYNPKVEYDSAQAQVSYTLDQRRQIAIILNTYQRSYQFIKYVISSNRLCQLGKDAFLKQLDFMEDVLFLKTHWPKKGTQLTNNTTFLFDIKKITNQLLEKKIIVKQHPLAGQAVLYKTTNKSKGQTKGQQRYNDDGTLMFYPNEIDAGFYFDINQDVLDSWLLTWETQLQILSNEIEIRNVAVIAAQQQLEMFEINTGVINFKPKIKSHIKSDNGKKPKRWIDKQWIAPLQWYSWPKNIEKYSRLKYASKETGIGSGEYWVAFLFGCQIQGQGISYDLQFDNEKWEVKEYDEKSRVIRLGGNGTDALIATSQMIINIFNEINDFVEMYYSLEIYDFYPNEKTWLGNFISSAKTFLTERYTKIILKGEIGNAELHELQYLVLGINKAINMIFEEHVPFVKRRNQFDNVDDNLLYGQILNLTAQINPQIYNLNDNEKMLILASVIKEPVLTGLMSFEDFLHFWVNNVKPTKAFGDIDGIFLVNRRGFMMVPRVNMDEIFSYYRLSTGHRPNFKVDNIESPITAVPVIQMMPLSGTFDLPPVNITDIDIDNFDEIMSLYEKKIEQFTNNWISGVETTKQQSSYVSTIDVASKQIEKCSQFGQPNPAAFLNVGIFNYNSNCQ